MVRLLGHKEPYDRLRDKEFPLIGWVGGQASSLV
jgi:hypothetical protein